MDARKKNTAYNDAWEATIDDFTTYLQFERSLSNNTVHAYAFDCRKLFLFCRTHSKALPTEVTRQDMEQFLASLYDARLSKRSQARIISGVR
ncbi:MAG: site-specific integrase, partial [Prevotellaceae bacterium]|nr:site-specific integrase [Prevotellaceae bacterium]